MHLESIAHWQHDHTFGQADRSPAERRTWIVVGLTLATMAVEVVAGLAYGSMALLADGLHMASHAAGIGIAACAYVLARRYARDPRFSFGTGKIKALAGFSSAWLLGLLALLMLWEAGARVVAPVPINFDGALLVAVVGLAVNGICALILGHGGAEEGGAHHHGHTHAHGHSHAHGHESTAHAADHNLRGAYLHVLVDAMTSVLAILALLGGKYLGALWMDPVAGLLGMVLTVRWSWGLLHQAGATLLDVQAPADVVTHVRRHLEQGADRVADLHVWAVAPGRYAAAITLVAADPQPPDVYRARLPAGLGIAHATVEVHQCPDEA